MSDALDDRIPPEDGVILLCSGDKGSQDRNLETAKKMGGRTGVSDGGKDMAIKTRPYDAADYLDTAADQADLLSDALDEGDARYIAYALGAAARARGGIGRLADDTGLSRQALHRALSADGNPTLDTVLRVLKALGLHMRIEETPRARELADAP